MFTWKSVYSDGSHLSQYNADGSENKYRDIDRQILESFELYSDDRLIYSLFLKAGQRLIFRRRNFIEVSNAGEKRWIVYLVGYQFNDETGKNYKVINYIYPEGKVELCDDRNDLELLPEEILNN